jgi:hypothetical protein
MGSIASYFLTPSLVVGGVVVLVLAGVGTWALRARLGRVGRRVFFFGVVVAAGGVMLATLLREPPLGPCLECLTRWGVERFHSGRLGLDVALNIALFVPLGLFATLLWKAPFRVTGAAALFSLAVEVVQPLLGVGANDLVDLAANSLGAFVGAGAASLVLLVRDWVVTKRLPGRRAVKFAVALVVTVGALLGVSVGGANAIQASAAAQLDGLFAGTTLADRNRDERDWTAEITEFWEANRMPVGDAHADDQVVLQRFTWTYYWATRCVTARWDPAGFSAILGSGGQCVERLR